MSLGTLWLRGSGLLLGSLWLRGSGLSLGSLSGLGGRGCCSALSGSGGRGCRSALSGLGGRGCHSALSLACVVFGRLHNAHLQPHASVVPYASVGHIRLPPINVHLPDVAVSIFLFRTNAVLCVFVHFLDIVVEFRSAWIGIKVNYQF